MIGRRFFHFHLGTGDGAQHCFLQPTRTFAYIRAADLSCVPSCEDPLDNAFLEGWRAGAPVVSIKFDGLSWAATDGENVLLVETDGSVATASMMEGLMASRNHAGRFPKAAGRDLTSIFRAEALSTAISPFSILCGSTATDARALTSRGKNK